MYAAQFPAVNPPPEVGDSSSLIGRTKRPHCPGARNEAPVFFWFIHKTAGADRPAQPHYVGPGTSSRMPDGMCGDNPNRRKHDGKK